MEIALLCLDPRAPIEGADGCSIQIRALASALLRAGHRVRALTTRPAPRGGSVWGAAFEHVPVPDACVDTVVAALRDAPADLVLEPLLAPTPVGALASDRLGLAHVYLVERAGDRAAREAEVTPVDMAEGFGASRGAIAFTGEAAHWVREQAPRRYPVRVTSFGIDPALLREPTAEARARARAVLRDWAGLRVGFAGTLSPGHDLEALVRALGRVRVVAPVQIAFIGDGPLRNHLIALAHHQQVSVAMVGPVPHHEVSAHLERCDVVAVPCTDPRGCDSPLKLIEAMAIGRPLVASATQMARHHVRDGHDGLLVPVGDEAALTAALFRLARTPALRERIGASAAQSARRRRSWDEVANDILDFGLTCAERVAE